MIQQCFFQLMFRLCRIMIWASRQIHSNWKNIPHYFRDIQPHSIVIKILEILIEQTLCLNGEYYRQLIETVVGTKYAPAYAALSLGYFEVSLWEKICNLCPKWAANVFKRNYKRFLDDILIIIDKKFPQKEDISILNSLDNQLTFNCKAYHLEVNF